MSNPMISSLREVAEHYAVEIQRWEAVKDALVAYQLYGPLPLSHEGFKAFVEEKLYNAQVQGVR